MTTPNEEILKHQYQMRENIRRCFIQPEKSDVKKLEETDKETEDHSEEKQP